MSAPVRPSMEGLLHDFDQVVDALSLMRVAVEMVAEANDALWAEFPNVDLDLLADLMWWQDSLASGEVLPKDLLTAVDRAHAVIVGAR